MAASTTPTAPSRPPISLPATSPHSAWAAEPHLEARKRIGLQVIFIFLLRVRRAPLFHQKEGVEVGRGALTFAKSPAGNGVCECGDTRRQPKSFHAWTARIAVARRRRWRRLRAGQQQGRPHRDRRSRHLPARKPRRIEFAPWRPGQRNILERGPSCSHRRHGSRRRSACISACVIGSSAGRAAPPSS